VNVAVIVYPGSNADWDALHVVKDVLGLDARYVFHKETSLAGFDAVVIPGGFAFGDYLRSGAIARFSPISAEVCRFAKEGRPVLGICNGFQVLTELHLLPGALVQNIQRTFVCQDVHVRVEAPGFFTRDLASGSVLRMPVAHAHGRYVCDDETLQALKTSRRIALRYCSAVGTVEEPCVVNGSIESIAGIYNPQGNVLGLMPHPERASEALLGSSDGKQLLEGLCAKA